MKSDNSSTLGSNISTVKFSIIIHTNNQHTVLDNVSIDRKAYPLSLEMLVKITGLKVIEIPYRFMENDKTKSKLIP